MLGEVVLVEGEQARDGHAPLTGVVVGSHDDQMIIELSCSSIGPPDGSRLAVSLFAPEALYRMSGTARTDEPGFLTLDCCEPLETIHRRGWPRCKACLPVAMVPVDQSVGGVRGETIDIGVGGALVRTMAPLPSGCDPLLALTLPGGDTLLIEGRVVAAESNEPFYEYRVAFWEPDEVAVGRLAELVSSMPAIIKGDRRVK